MSQNQVRVCAEPPVELHVAERTGSGGQALLVVHGGPDWDHTYLIEPLIRLPVAHRVLFPDLRGCGSGVWVCEGFSSHDTDVGRLGDDPSEV